MILKFNNVYMQSFSDCFHLQSAPPPPLGRRAGGVLDYRFNFKSIYLTKKDMCTRTRFLVDIQNEQTRLQEELHAVSLLAKYIYAVLHVIFFCTECRRW